MSLRRRRSDCAAIAAEEGLSTGTEPQGKMNQSGSLGKFFLKEAMFVSYTFQYCEGPQVRSPSVAHYLLAEKLTMSFSPRLHEADAAALVIDSTADVRVVVLCRLVSLCQEIFAPELFSVYFDHKKRCQRSGRTVGAVPGNQRRFHIHSPGCIPESHVNLYHVVHIPPRDSLLMFFSVLPITDCTSLIGPSG